MKGYDYSQAGAYFITICCQDRICRFGNVFNGEMNLNPLGQTAYDEWGKLRDRFPNIELDVFQIMPNHIHGIIVLNPVGAGVNPAPNTQNDPNNRATARVAPTVGDIVGAYKSLVANGCLEIYKLKNEMMGKLWQRNYWERIIRDEQSYQTISRYIMNNPANWSADKFYL
ncbi:MAG TPA: hypothetical protein PK299_11080 [Anaerolineales bacterium]|nr:hypothetical protein [Anaerolineales bacterium]